MFLIYVGGILVIFAYFVALTPNLLIEGPKLIQFTLLSSIIIIITLPLTTILSQAEFSLHLFHNMPALLNLHNSIRLIILALILFLALVAVVKICSHSSSPLRPFN